MRGQKPGRGTKDEMKNSTEYLKQCKVPIVSEKLSPSYLEKNNAVQKAKRKAWGNDDYKELIRINMEGSKYDKSN